LLAVAAVSLVVEGRRGRGFLSTSGSFVLSGGGSSTGPNTAGNEEELGDSTEIIDLGDGEIGSAKSVPVTSTATLVPNQAQPAPTWTGLCKYDTHWNCELWGKEGRCDAATIIDEKMNGTWPNTRSAWGKLELENAQEYEGEAMPDAEEMRKACPNTCCVDECCKRTPPRKPGTCDVDKSDMCLGWRENCDDPKWTLSENYVPEFDMQSQCATTCCGNNCCVLPVPATPLQAQVAAAASPAQDQNHVRNAAKCACPKDGTCHQTEDVDDTMKVIGTLDCSSQLNAANTTGNDCPDNLSKGKFFGVAADGSGSCTPFYRAGLKGIPATNGIASFVEDTQTYCLSRDPEVSAADSPHYIYYKDVKEVRGWETKERLRTQEMKRREDKEKLGIVSLCPFKQTPIRKGLIQKVIFGHLHGAPPNFGWVALKRMVCEDTLGGARSVSGTLCHVFKTAVCIKCPFNKNNNVWSSNNNVLIFSNKTAMDLTNKKFMEQGGCFQKAWKNAGKSNAELHDSYRCDSAIELTNALVADAFQVAVKSF